MFGEVEDEMGSDNCNRIGDAQSKFKYKKCEKYLRS